MRIIRELDPEGVALRRSHRLARRVYLSRVSLIIMHVHACDSSCLTHIIYMWQSRIEIEYCSALYVSKDVSSTHNYNMNLLYHDAL